MTRPPRPKYPSDSKNYHDIRKPGCAHTVRLPEELIEKYVALKNALGSRKSHADVIRFLFEAAEPAIAAVMQQREDHVVIDSEEIPIVEPEIQHDPDEIVDDETFDNDGSECSDVDIAREAIPEVVADSEDDEQSCCMDSQPQQSADSALRVYPDATYGFWSKNKVMEFFLKFPVYCPAPGCGLRIREPKVSEFQQVWSLQLKCQVDHSFSFLSGELKKDHGVPDVTGKLYHSTLCSGMKHTTLESICSEVGLHVPRKAHFFDFQSGKRRKPGWISATLELWEENKNKLHADLLRSGKPLVLYVDCRFDSSRSGFHGTLPVINVDDDRVIEMHNILSSKDLWHKCKNIMSKFKEVLQEKRRSPSGSVDSAGTIAQVAVFSVAQLRDFCRENGLPTGSAKLALVQRVSVFLQLPEAGATTELQRQRPLKYPELAQHDIAYKLKSWIYTCAKNAAARGDTTPQVLTKDVQNAAEHWAGNHAVCRTLPGQRKCVVENWEPGRDNKYVEGSETHKAVSDFLRKYLTENKMKFYLRARENFISETFHSVINKYATKRIHFDSSHVARLTCAALDWNENIRREVRVVYNRNANNMAVRRRARTNRVLAPSTSTWKNQIAQKVFN
ncbi:hypothetical protein R1sor_009514 [Riccia sorocarpa]|uniref:SAP domain-containing protein n=1 Tax=Riccia sorocarpa TaxID=122646 RepID=A0ABD3HVK6_9MARC